MDRVYVILDVMESKTDPVGTVATYKAKNSKQARYGRDESNVPSSV